ncbi:olfactory receptor 14I1-like [Ahaetulla prasina]|uniref:olfactory receptor 14I1-like n=1 Tax=Ahaetulla prasina TaxID=499056 RepID=UPI0026496252|nr:olfactory receptor 14I1-like [Ahaetulla prasina]
MFMRLQNMDNQSTMPYFLLLEFSAARQLQLLYSFLFFVLYMTITAANLLIISAIAFDRQLHKPMYFFLMNLAVQDVGSVSVIVPKSIMNSLRDTRHISYFGCIAQVFLFVSFLGSNLSLLTVMAYDRYVAICNPLHYEMVMNWKACTEMMILVWFAGLLYGTLHVTGTFTIVFCSNAVNQFFCEIPHLLKLSCTGFNLVEIGVLVTSAVAALGCCTFIIVSYAMIFKAVLGIPSQQGRQKALSTCIPHLTVVFMFFLTGCFANLRPTSDTPTYLNFGLTLMYSVLPPLFNPIMYSMRNKNIRFVLSKLWRF